MKTIVSTIHALGVCAALSLCPSTSAQQSTSIASDALGFITLTVRGASSATMPGHTLLSLPLTDRTRTSGKIAAVGAGTLTLAGTPSFTFDPANPCFIRLLSGAHAGRTFLITSSSGATLTVETQGSTLDSLTPGIATGDRYRIFSADTLSIFTPFAQGATSPEAADQVWIWEPDAGSYTRYYYHTGNSRWQDVGFDQPASHVVLRPDSGIVFMRRATSDLAIVIPGHVPTTDTLFQVRNSGCTMISPGFPVDTTLSGLGLHNQSNWVKATTEAQADQVWIWEPDAGTYTKYYYHSGNGRWQDAAFDLPADSAPIPAGTAIMIKKASAAAGYTTGSAKLPYAL